MTSPHSSSAASSVTTASATVLRNAEYASYRIGEVARVLAVLPERPTPVLVGEPGIGKTEVIRGLAALDQFKDHHLTVLEGTTLESGDVCLPRVVDTESGLQVLRTIIHESLGFASNKPSLVFIDEIGKTSPPVKNALLSMLYEHRMGNLQLPKGSRIICATNAAEHMLRDSFMAHEINRLMFFRITKPLPEEWCAWAKSQGLDPLVIAWVRSRPALLEDWAPNHSNPYIFSLDATRKNKIFVSPRSLAAWARVYASVKDRADILALGASGLSGLAQSVMGQAAATDFMNFLAFENQIPSFDDIFADPLNTKLPMIHDFPPVINRAACLYMCFAAVGAIRTTEQLDQFMLYLDGIEDKSIGAVFVRDFATNPEKMTICAVSEHFNRWIEESGIVLG